MFEMSESKVIKFDDTFWYIILLAILGEDDEYETLCIYLSRISFSLLKNQEDVSIQYFILIL